jgi:hypothetical protein
MRCLRQRDQKRHSNGAQSTDLIEKLRGGMLPAFPQQFLPGFSTDLHQFVQLLMELLGATTHTRLH